MAIISVPSKDPNNVEPFYFVWCSRNGTNDGSTSDTGELQGATISSYTVTVATGITKNSDNKGAVTIRGISYAINTVVTVWLSGGSANSDYSVNCQVVLSDGRTLEQSILIPVRES